MAPDLRDDALIVRLGRAAVPAVERRLESDGYRVLSLCGAGDGGGVDFRSPDDGAPGEIRSLLAARMPGFQPGAVVLAAEPPEARGVDAVEVAAFVDALDRYLSMAGRVAKALFTIERPPRPTRTVVLVDWMVTSVPGHTASSAVMGGLLGLARSWSLEFAPFGVTVNAVVVGPGAGSDGTPDRTDEAWLARRPTPDDVAHAVTFFLDPRSSAITGQVLSVCGGRTAGRLTF